MSDATVDNLVEEAILEYTFGNYEQALALLDQAQAVQPDSFAVWHTRTEVLFARRQLDAALAAAERALLLSPEDVHIHTSLSRIWMEKGDKSTAEEYSAKARMLGWKKDLQSGPDEF